MSDYLYIDTSRARSAAQHLRAMSASGADVANDVRTAFALAGLADTCGPHLIEVSDALADLATVLQERSDAADAGGLLPYRATSVALSSITESLYGYTPPTVEELFPIIGPATNRIESTARTPPALASCVVEDDEDGNGWGLPGWLRDPIDDLLAPIMEQPVSPLIDPRRLPWDEIGGVLDSVTSLGSEIDERLHEFDEQLHDLDDRWRDVGDRLEDLDWGPVERLGERVVDTVTDPYVLVASVIVPGAIPLDIASNYGILSASIAGAGIAYTTTDDGDRAFGLMVPTAWPLGPLSLLPTHTFTQTSKDPENGLSITGVACDVICAGAVVDGDGVHPVVGVGPPGASGTASYTWWYELDDGRD